jgi:hypothetical protein
MHAEALGRLFNVHYPADDVYISLKDAAGVTFIGHEVDGATAFTLTYAADAAGTGAVTPASETFTAADGTEDLVAVYVNAASCPEGKPYVKLAADGSGTVLAILHDLAYQRAPQNLRSVTA